MAGERNRDVTGVTSIPLGVAATGTLSQDTQVPTVLIGTGTILRTDLDTKARPFLFFPNTSPPQLLQVVDFTAADKSSGGAYGTNGPVVGNEWIKVKTAPGVAITNQSFTVIQATLKRFSVLNKGDNDATNGYDGVVTIVTNETINEPMTNKTGIGPYDPKDAHWVDGTGTVLEINENP